MFTGSFLDYDKCSYRKHTPFWLNAAPNGPILRNKICLGGAHIPSNLTKGERHSPSRLSRESSNTFIVANHVLCPREPTKPSENGLKAVLHPPTINKLPASATTPANCVGWGKEEALLHRSLSVS